MELESDRLRPICERNGRHCLYMYIYRCLGVNIWEQARLLAGVHFLRGRLWPVHGRHNVELRHSLY
jgi:hypothetical protein